MSKSIIYQQHDAAFANVSAFVIAKDGERVATIAFKFPRGESLRLWAYVHWIGVEMVRGYAGGGGYDKRSRAALVAARKLECTDDNMRAFVAALEKGDDGAEWQSALMNAGFKVWSAV